MGFGLKWKRFFQELELGDGLDVNSTAHIWLLHHLFLDAINQDALNWAESWNNHSITLRGSRNRSPRDMFFFGMIERGARGLQVMEDEHVEDPHSYGIDWSAYDDSQLLDHHDSANALEEQSENPFVTNGPEDLSIVEVPEANCPFSLDCVRHLDEVLGTLAYFHSTSMHSRRLVWIRALETCIDMYIA